MLAERAAWEFAEAHPGLDLVTINPYIVIGPSLGPSLNTSNSIIRDLMAGRYPAIMNLSWGFVDVRDVARIHVLAMKNKQAHGRYLSANTTVSMRQIVELLRRQGYTDFDYPRLVLTSMLGDVFMRLGSYARPRGTGSYLRTHLGKVMRYDNRKVRQELGIEFIPVEQTIVETADDLIRWGHVKPRNG